MAWKIGEKLPEGTVLKTLHGEAVRVIGFIAEGGQADVYKAAWKNGTYALKWYNKTAVDTVGSDQYGNLKKLSQYPNPDPGYFVWPLDMVTESGKETSKALFGYVMELLPEGYHELKYYLCDDTNPKRQRFTSFHAMIRCALQIVTAVGILHHKGMSYKDLNPGNVSIQNSTGSIKMVDCDNISVEGSPCTVSGMHGYMAPEIVRSDYKVTPDINTDMYSEAILLFKLFYMDHPMEGRHWADFEVHTDAVEDELYSLHPVYSMSSKDSSNRPGLGFAPNVIPRMQRLPAILRKGFEEAFTDGIDHPARRPSENRWMDYLTTARDQFTFLDQACKKEQCVVFSDPKTIPPGCLRMTVGNAKRVWAVYPMQSLFENTVTNLHANYQKRIGWVTVSNRMLYMQNL